MKIRISTHDEKFTEQNYRINKFNSWYYIEYHNNNSFEVYHELYQKIKNGLQFADRNNPDKIADIILDNIDDENDGIIIIIDTITSYIYNIHLNDISIFVTEHHILLYNNNEFGQIYPHINVVKLDYSLSIIISSELNNIVSNKFSTIYRKLNASTCQHSDLTLSLNRKIKSSNLFHLEIIRNI